MAALICRTLGTTPHLRQASGMSCEFGGAEGGPMPHMEAFRTVFQKASQFARDPLRIVLERGTNCSAGESDAPDQDAGGQQIAYQGISR